MVSLGMRALHCFPVLLGYVGVDAVLGMAVDGSGDRAIEINPRMTTSYVGLRALTDDNLVAASLVVADWGMPNVRWRTGSVTFSADWVVTSRLDGHADEGADGV
jgi:predicted ATP-grasp superfamily ATP-dependent carboligase